MTDYGWEFYGFEERLNVFMNKVKFTFDRLISGFGFYASNHLAIHPTIKYSKHNITNHIDNHQTKHVSNKIKKKNSFKF